jgi:DNA-binding FadR family transcriptional regulator
VFLPPEKKDKISDYIIDQIRDGILSGKFKAGEFLGLEKDLLADFGVSKASIREALRVLEVMGLVEIKAGISGGIFVAEVDEKATIYNIISILHHKTPSPGEITTIRYILEPIAVRIAAEKSNQKDIEKLNNIITGRVGFTSEDDKLPERLHKELLKEGPPKGKCMPKEEFDKAMKEYYSFRGWDRQGRPTLEKLRSLGIEEEFIVEYEKFLNI